MLVNAKSFCGDECTSQHLLVVSDFRLRARTQRHKPNWKRKIQKFKDRLNSQRFRTVLVEAVDEKEEAEIEIRGQLEVPKVQPTEGYRPRVTWWWNRVDSHKSKEAGLEEWGQQRTMPGSQETGLLSKGKSRNKQVCQCTTACRPKA